MLQRNNNEQQQRDTSNFSLQGLRKGGVCVRHKYLSTPLFFCCCFIFFYKKNCFGTVRAPFLGVVLLAIIPLFLTMYPVVIPPPHPFIPNDVAEAMIFCLFVFLFDFFFFFLCWKKKNILKNSLEGDRG